MSDLRKEPVASNSINNLRSSFKPLSPKGFALLGATSQKQQVKYNQMNQINDNKLIENSKNQEVNIKNNIISPRNIQQDKKNFGLSMKQFQTKIQGVYNNLKKNPVNFDINYIPRRKNSQQISNLTINKLTQQNQHQHHNSIPSQKKQELRTSFSINNLTPKTFDKDFLRKTTFTPIKGLFNQKSQSNQQNQYGSPQRTEHANLNNQGVESSPKYFFKKGNYELRTQNPNPSHNQSNYNSKTTNKVLSNFNLQKQGSKKSPIVCGFYIGKSLGAGKFGEVYLAKHVISGFVCALKKIQKAKVKQFNMLSQLIQQIKLHAFLNHPNIIQFYGVISDETSIYIILEYMQGGTLFDYMNDKDKLPQNQVILFIRETVQAVKYLHDIDIAHRDIKPENIVMSYGLAKLCDFGWAARVQGARKTYCGTFDYAPPQILQRKQYDTTVDLWCIGILTYELLTGKVPFEHKQRKMVMHKIVNVDKDKIVYPQDMSIQAKQFIENLVKKNPNERIKSYKLLDQAFLKKTK